MLIFEPNFSFKNFLSSFDYIVIAAIFMLHVLAMFYSRSSQNKTPSRCLTVGKQLALPLFVPTLVVSWYGKFFYVTQSAFDNGLYNFYTQGVFWYIAYMMFALHIVKKIRAYNAANFPDLINKMYGNNSSTVAAILIVIKALPIGYIASLIMTLQMFMNISFWPTMSVVMLWLIFSAKTGSMRTNIYSNVIHFICLISAVLLLAICAVTKWGGLSFLYANLPAAYFQPRGMHGIASMLAWFALAITTTFISPIFYQHCIAAESDRAAKVGIIICTAFWILIDVCTTTGAMYAKAVFPNAQALVAYGALVSSLLPTGVKGLFVAGVLGTIIPSISAYLAIIKSSLEYEQIKNYKSKNLLVFCSGMSIFVALIFHDGWFIIKSYFVGCLFIPVIIGFFMPRIITRGAFACSVVLSGISMLLSSYYNVDLNVGIDLSIMGCAASFIVFAFKYFYFEYKLYNAARRRIMIMTN